MHGHRVRSGWSVSSAATVGLAFCLWLFARPKREAMASLFALQ